MRKILCKDCFDKLVEISGKDYEVLTIGSVTGSCYFCYKQLSFDTIGRLLA